MKRDKLVCGYLEKTMQSMLRAVKETSGLNGVSLTTVGFRSSTNERSEVCM